MSETNFNFNIALTKFIVYIVLVIYRSNLYSKVLLFDVCKPT